MRRHERTDVEWARREPLLPPRRTRGRHDRDHRVICNGMLFVLPAGIAWRDLPPRDGPWEAVYRRFQRWSLEGLWDRLLVALQRNLEAQSEIDSTL